jgi:hypothetical protein
LRQEYRRNFDAFCERLRRRCGDMGIDYQLLRTDMAVDRALGAYLTRRHEW